MNGTTEKDTIFINRELSWLEFDRRVLELAKDKSVPLAEQLNFASIYASNLDEFFMIRVGSLYDQTLLKEEKRENKTNMTPNAQLRAIMPVAEELQGICDKILVKLFERLAEFGYEKVDFENISKDDERVWKKYFLSELYPVLSPQIIDRRHPFPFLRNLEVYIGARVREKDTGNESFGLIPISSQFDRLVFIKQNNITLFAPVEDVVRHFAHLAFGRYAVLESFVFRVTRNADINIQEGMQDQDIDYREVMSELLKKRRKLAAVRLQFSPKTSQDIASFLCHKLLLDERQSFRQSAPLDMGFTRMLAGRLSKEGLSQLFYTPVRPLLPAPDFSLTKAVQKQDVLVAYPYQSIRPFIQLLQDAAADPAVVSIKMTLYRMATDSKIVEALMSAAENGKEVVTIVELRARFDEQNNIDWSKQLESAGCTVIYGFEDYKVHSKLTLITRKVGGQFQYISQIGTGNYNEKTAELYTDLAFLSADQALGEEVAEVFNDLALEKVTTHTNRLLVAPCRFKSVLMEEIQREIDAKRAGHEAAILLKCNSVSDRDLIVKLSEASCAGINVDMIVRGICCFKAGMQGETEHIQVHSIVGRYLEHSRIYVFGTGENQRVYIASGDFLTRNTERRVEIGVRIEDAAIKKVLIDILQYQLKDNVNTRLMQPDGTYAKVKRVGSEDAVDSQMEMYHYFADSWNRYYLAYSTALSAKERKHLLRPAARKGTLLGRLVSLIKGKA